MHTGPACMTMMFDLSNRNFQMALIPIKKNQLCYIILKCIHKYRCSGPEKSGPMHECKYKHHYDQSPIRVVVCYSHHTSLQWAK